MRTLPALSRALAAAAAALLGLSGCDLSVNSLPLPGGVDLGNDAYTVTAQFRDVLDLVPQSSVKVDDVTVGKVDDVDLDGYTAEVTLKLRGDVTLPDNAVAEIRQTSLLGEKFVSLSPPPLGARDEPLSDGDVIPLGRTGRNPEVEEVLGALSLVLNGGGVGQLKIIANEVNQALSGREGDVRSVLRRTSRFMRQVDDNKAAIVTALARVNDLSVSLNRQTRTLDLALDEMPGALASVNRQRADLVTMLRALARLSDVGTRVVQASKASTIDSLRALAPTLDKLADAGDDFPRALQIGLTYPFVDAVVGTNPQQARDLHTGDYTNLSVQLDLDLRNGLPQPPGLPGAPTLPDLVEQCRQTPLAPICNQLPDPTLPPLPIPSIPVPTLGPGLGGGSGGGSSCLLGPLLCRVAPGTDEAPRAARHAPTGLVVTASGSAADPALGALLVWGLVKR